MISFGLFFPFKILHPYLSGKLYYCHTTLWVCKFISEVSGHFAACEMILCFNLQRICKTLCWDSADYSCLNCNSEIIQIIHHFVSIQDSSRSLAGEKGYGNLRNLQKLLRRRQQHMVSQVSLLYPVKVLIKKAPEQELESFSSSIKSGNGSYGNSRNLGIMYIVLYSDTSLCW